MDTPLDEWEGWCERARRFVALPPVAVDAPDAARALDAALKELEALQLQEERRAATAAQLLRHLAAPPPEAQELEPLRQALAEAETAVTAARAGLETAQEQAAAERSRQVALPHSGSRPARLSQNVGTATELVSGSRRANRGVDAIVHDIGEVRQALDAAAASPA